jgi:alpha-L-rhamnosidase
MLTMRSSIISLLLAAGIVGAATHAASAQSATSHDRAAGPTLAVARLETDATAEPLGIDDRTPRMTWALASERRGVMQRSYRVLVATRPELLKEGRADIWDSREVRSAEPFTLYSGPALRPRTRYLWSVRATTTNGDTSAWSPPSWFETALLGPTEWRGQWIAGPERALRLTVEEGVADDSLVRKNGELCRPVRWLTSGFAARLVKNNEGECRELRPAPMLRKSFQVTKPVARARVYTTGLGINDLRVNGAPASDRVLDPAFTRYSQTVLYTTHDVTSLLRQGENVIATELGSGQFDDAARTWDWGWHEAEWRATPRLRLDLYVTYADGTEDVISSDASWKTSVAGPTRYDNYYLGETYDARREVAGWDRPGFDAAAWQAARVVGAPLGVVRAEAHEPIRVVSTREPGTRTEPSPGVIVYDVGQTLTGWATLRIAAPNGTPIEVFYSEKRDSTGRASIVGNDLVFGQLQTDYYVARGSGVETWSPRFTNKGFRFVQISAPNGQPLPAGVTVTIERIDQVRSGVTATSGFVSSNGTLNRIHGNTAWAIQSNLQGVITDTPVYEKNAWTGDAQLTSGTASTLFDTERLYRKMFQDMLDDQTVHGEVSLLAPTNQNYGYAGKPAFKPADCCGATPAWDAFWFVIPWEAYQRFGDVRALAKTYPAMQRYLDDWIPQWTSRDGDGLAYTLTSGLGDWVPPQGVPTVNRIASTAYYAHMARIAARAATVLGRSEDAARYDTLFSRIRRDFNTAFLGADGVYRERPIPGAAPAAAGGPPAARVPMRDYVQTAQILPLAFGLVPDSLRASVAAKLAADIVEKSGGNAYVGVLGARYVLPVLTATGHHDAAYTVATQTDEPSWGYWTDSLHFTALGEHWYAATRSQNHHMFGAIVQWFYEDLAGMRALEPGYRRIEFRPEVPSRGLDSVAVSYESVRGLVASRWRRVAGGLELDVIIPPNATGVVYVPATSAARVTEIGGGRAVPADRAASVRLLRTEGGRVLYEVGSGHYQFRVRGGA